MKVAYCRSCGSPIQWVRHGLTGKVSPIDVTPSVEGNLRLVPHPLHESVYLVTTKEERAQATRLFFTSHFMTCPAASAWRNQQQQSATATLTEGDAQA